MAQKLSGLRTFYNILNTWKISTYIWYYFWLWINTNVNMNLKDIKDTDFWSYQKEDADLKLTIDLPQ